MSESGAEDGYEGVTHAGIAVIAADTGAVFLAQRELDPTDAPDVAETYEFPGGALEPGENPEAAAFREFYEEIGVDLQATGGEVTDGWRSGPYQGFVYMIPAEFSLDGWDSTDEVQDAGWFDQAGVDALIESGEMRPEIVATMDWNLVFPETEGDVMAEQTEMEPALSLADLTMASIPIHGVLAPEDAESGDSRGFNAGSVSARPYRLPFMWQREQTSGHDGASVVGSVDRLMRKDGLIHWEGSLMPTDAAGDFAELLAFFGRFGVSVDGDKGALDTDKTRASGVMWFEAVRAAGLTAVSIPAFAEAYVAFGLHPDMPEVDDPANAVLAASGNMITFDRGPGWVTNPDDTKRLHDYWMPGHPGGDKIAWGTPGDFTRAKRLIGEKIGANSPEKMRFLNQIIAQWHHDALGYWPGDLGKPGNAPDTAENRKRAATHAAAEHGIIEVAEHLRQLHNEAQWEAVLVSSVSGNRALPPAEYFTRHPNTGALVIEEPDANGLRRTYGYAAEWGVCHVGYAGRCVEPPRAGSDEYKDFHLGRTKVLAEGFDGKPEAQYVNTGVLTYLVDHRDAQAILSETPEQQHYDNVANAWAAVRVGEDERGVWFSGVVLPKIDAEDCTLIEATGQVSGEWKYGSMRAAQAVNVPGYPVQRASAAFGDDGEVLALVAVTTGKDMALVASINGVEESECAPTKRMHALRDAYALVKMDEIKKKAAL